MARQRHPLTDAVQAAVCAYLRAGCFPSVAAEAAGVPAVVFRDWLRRGSRPRAGIAYRRFADAVRQAKATARLKAETTLLSDKPLDWLRYGPGRPTPRRPGWTAAARAPQLVRGSGGGLRWQDLAAAAAGLRDALGGFPESQAAVDGWLAGQPKRPAGPSANGTAGAEPAP